MNIKNKKQRVFRGILALLACSFAIAPALTAVVKAENAPTSTAPTLATLSQAKLPNIAAYAKLIDLKSFLGKPVRIPVASENPAKTPGGDMDYVYIFPPQFYKNKKTGKIVSLPIKSIYFASGKSISPAKQKEVQSNLENFINNCFCDQGQTLLDLKDALARQASAPDKPRSYLDGIYRIFNIVQAADTTATDTAGTGIYDITDEDIQTLLDSDDPQMKQMLMLLLLNLLLSQKTAAASNVDKQTCLDNGGDWVNEACVMPDENKKTDDSKKQAACEDSGGSWKSFTSSRSLCLTRCGMTDEKCQGSALADFEESEGLITSSSSSGGIKGCKCPEGQCADADNKCIDDKNQNKDEDEDNVPDGQDKCAKSAPDGSGTVNMNASSPYYGCTCSQIQAKGGFQQQQTCPPGQCEGPYWTEYTSQPGNCSNGNITQGQCVANRNTANQQMQQQCYQQDQRNQANQQAQQQQAQKALQDLMKQLTGQGQQGKGSQGDQGKGQQGCGQQQQGGPQGQPQTGDPRTGPQTVPQTSSPGVASRMDWPDGSSKINYKDGTAEYKSSNGDTTKWNADSSRSEFSASDGKITTYDSQGTKTGEYSAPNQGEASVFDSSGKNLGTASTGSAQGYEQGLGYANLYAPTQQQVAQQLPEQLSGPGVTSPESPEQLPEQLSGPQAAIPQKTSSALDMFQGGKEKFITDTVVGATGSKDVTADAAQQAFQNEMSQLDPMTQAGDYWSQMPEYSTPAPLGDSGAGTGYFNPNTPPGNVSPANTGGLYDGPAAAGQQSPPPVQNTPYQGMGSGSEIPSSVIEGTGWGESMFGNLSPEDIKKMAEEIEKNVKKDQEKEGEEGEKPVEGKAGEAGKDFNPDDPGFSL